MQDDKSIKKLVVGINDTHQLFPVAGHHVRRVYRRIERVGADAAVETLQFGYLFQQQVEVETFQGTGFLVLYHANGSARIYEQNTGTACIDVGHKQIKM